MVSYRHILSLPIVVALAAIACPLPLDAEELKVASYEPIGSEVKPPSGWLQFCRDWPGECHAGTVAAEDITMTPAAWQEIDGVNRLVNGKIRPVTDLDHYGRSEYWTYPRDDKGDCEDYLLLKRKMLMEKGYPEQALLITVVALANGDGHAVLTIRSDHGDFVLDNLRNVILPWAATGYRFVKRQSQTNPNIWTALGEEAPKAVAAAK
jgi:predicted transglutaminase-like cysteine proteinase